MGPSRNAASGTPIYRQFVDQIVQLVAVGALSAGDPLPSARAVAADLGVNPVAVSRAYGELARNELLACRCDVGMVVAGKAVDAAEAMRPHAEAPVDAALRIGLSRAEVAVAVQRAWEAD